MSCGAKKAAAATASGAFGSRKVKFSTENRIHTIFVPLFRLVKQMSAQATAAAMMERDERGVACVEDRVRDRLGDRIEEQANQRIEEVVAREGGRLRSFIRRRVADAADVEDVLQDVFFELVRANRMLVPIDFVTGWLFTVARNRITDLFRKQKPENWTDAAGLDEAGEPRLLEEILPSPDDGPEAIAARWALLREIDRAIEGLPEEQRAVFVAHEFEGLSFKEIAAETGVNVNTLLSRKRLAVKDLRRRLQRVHEEFLRD
jgi:RNA polymerase sigma factor (sigma-70 family)